MTCFEQRTAVEVKLCLSKPSFQKALLLFLLLLGTPLPPCGQAQAGLLINETSCGERLLHHGCPILP